MKKTKIFPLLFFFFLALPFSASASCTWREQFIITDPETGMVLSNTGGCSSNETRPVSGGSENCTGASPGGSYVCCCSTSQTTQSTKPAEAPKFTIPQFQVPIDTVKLSAIDPNKHCVINDDGSYQCSIPWIGEYIKGIYQYGLSIAGILAAIILMAAGLLWLVSGGDAGKIGQAKEMIFGSLTGVIILASAYLILDKVNPNLINMPNIGIGVIADGEPISNEGNPTESNDCNNCVILDSSIPHKNGDELNSDLNNKLVAAMKNSGNLKWRVTEAYPPSSRHNSKCHYNGMCVDVALTSDKSCPNVEKFINIMKGAGLSVLNEYAGCKGKQTTYSTGGHLHVR